MNENICILKQMNYDEYIPKEKFRINVYNKINNLFISHINLFPKKERTKSTCQKLSINLEKSIFNFTIDQLKMENQFLNRHFQTMYVAKACSIYINLDINNSLLNNNYLLPAILSGKINLLELVNFGPDQMFPEKYNQLVKDNVEEIFVSGQSDIPEDYIGAHKCSRCKSWRTTYYLLSVRKADEAQSVFVTCHCGHKWNYNP
jgi:hypothetical protein